MRTKKRVSIVGTVGIPAKYGGFETLVEHLTKNLNSKFDITVFCSSKAYDKKLNRYNGSNLEYIDLNANGIQSIIYDIVSIFKAIKNSDIILILGVSGCIILPLVRIFSKNKIVVNIDGLEWKRGKWNWYAKSFLKLSEEIAVRNSDVVITDNRVIQEYVKSEYNLDSVFIPYGADHTTKEPLSNKLKVEFPFLNFKYAFTVCRIEPENNIHIILEAFRNFNSLNLVIVGNWNHSDYSRALRDDYSAYSNIFLIDPIYEQKKLNAIRSNCYIYLHGHSAGGTNPSLVEAMYLKLPIISFDINYNRETTKNRALYFSNENDLVKTIKSVSKDDLKKVAIDMFNIAIREYTWDKVSNRYSNVMSGLYGLAQIEDKNCSI